jgi:peptidoglycan/xylan/chitin deacetylase (PgdA/CDA1 family)
LLFERCLRWLRNAGFTFISADELVAIRRGRADPAPGAVWISIDDGWRGNLSLLALIERYRVPVTIFLTTEAVDPLGVFWWTCVRDHRQELPKAFRSRVMRVWDLPETLRRELVEPLLRRHAGEYSRQALTAEEVRTLARMPLVSFGSHTVRHPRLPRCDAGQLDEEFRTSKRQIEDWTRRPVRILAYPRSEFDGREEEALVRNGYEMAVTVEERVYRPGADNPYYVPRIVVGEDSVFSANVCKMVGAWRPYVGWARKIRAAVFG